MDNKQIKAWIDFKKRLDCLPVPYKTAFERFVLSIGKVDKEDELKSVSNEVLSNAKNKYNRIHKNIWKDMQEEYEKQNGYTVKKDDLKRYMRRPIKNGIYLDFFSNFFKLDKRYIVYRIKRQKRKMPYSKRELSYLIFENEENGKKIMRQQLNIKSRFLSLDEKTQKALIQLVQTVSVLLCS